MGETDGKGFFNSINNIAVREGVLVRALPMAAAETPSLD